MKLFEGSSKVASTEITRVGHPKEFMSSLEPGRINPSVTPSNLFPFLQNLFRIFSSSKSAHY